MSASGEVTRICCNVFIEISCRPLCVESRETMTTALMHYLGVGQSVDHVSLQQNGVQTGNQIGRSSDGEFSTSSGLGDVVHVDT